jgi:putative transcription antitermination factor YqgF
MIFPFFDEIMMSQRRPNSSLTAEENMITFATIIIIVIMSVVVVCGDTRATFFYDTTKSNHHRWHNNIHERCIGHGCTTRTWLTLPSRRLSSIMSSFPTSSTRHDNSLFSNRNIPLLLPSLEKQSITSTATNATTSSSSSSSSSKSSIIFDLTQPSVAVAAAAAASTRSSCSLLGMKSIGIDYGLIRTGVAVTVGYNPIPITTIISNNNNNTNVCREIIQILHHEQHVQRVIIGYPIHKNGTIAMQTNVTQLFGMELVSHIRQEFGSHIVVHWWDERYTSQAATIQLHHSNNIHHNNPRVLPSRHRDCHGTLDAISACLILEDYYYNNGANAMEVSIPSDVEQECLRIFYQQQQSKQQQQQQQHRLLIHHRGETRLYNRKLAIAQARQEEENQFKVNNDYNNNETNRIRMTPVKNKKLKKKRN